MKSCTVPKKGSAHETQGELASIFRAAWLGRAEAVRAGLWG